MSWTDAKKDAANWLKEMHLPADMKGQTLDLTTLSLKLGCDGTYRQMMVRAATRELRQRGAKVK